MAGRVPRAALIGFICILALAVAGTAVFAARGHKPRPIVGKKHLVAPVPTPKHPRPGPVPSCLRPTIKCVRTEIRRMKALEERLGCDHRAVFATTYRVLTEVALRTMQRNPEFLRWPRWFFFEDGLFADVYFATVHAWPAGKRVGPAWRVAFETARDADVTATQDMLLGINGHVQNDMPYVIAALGTRTRNGTSRKPDHDKFNEVLSVAYQEVVDEVERRYDPAVGITNPDFLPADDELGKQLVKDWRERVWQNAERLIATRGNPAARAEVVREIEQNSADWARLIAADETPGYRAQRDAYCNARLEAEGG